MLGRRRGWWLRRRRDVVARIIKSESAPDVLSEVPPRLIGEMVHKALQWDDFYDDPDKLVTKLRCYAWELGIADPAQTEKAVQNARALLEWVEQSAFIQKVRQARPSYRELPFTLQWGERTINGKIDVLYQDEHRHWAVLDYKTDVVKEPAFVAMHAQRYHMQVGLYAAAVEELTGQVPNLYLHYIRPAVTLHVPETTWRAALANLEANIMAALDDETA